MVMMDALAQFMIIKRLKTVLVVNHGHPLQ
jgi:hypothetical protein